MPIETIDLTPSPEAYRALLKHVQKYSTRKDSRTWAQSELERVGDVQQWSESVQRIGGRKS